MTQHSGDGEQDRAVPLRLRPSVRPQAAAEPAQRRHASECARRAGKKMGRDDEDRKVANGLEYTDGA